jgi:hypothetical protein
MHPLLQTNRCWLQQALDLLKNLDDAAYASSPQGLEPHRAGGHLRHIIEFYECFLLGMQRGYIDYDARARDLRVETNRAVAMVRIHQLLSRLTELERLECDARLWVKAEASDANGVLGKFLASSVGRELQVLSSHTVHHFALMAVTLRALGASVPKDFGVAPSTLRHRQATEAAA